MSSEANLGHEVHIGGAPAPSVIPGPRFAVNDHASIDKSFNEEVAGVLVGSGDDTKDLPQDVRDLIARCMAQEEPRTRPLRDWEPDKLSARHVMMCMLRAAGFRTGEIAGILGLGQPSVSNALCSEYGQKVTRAIMYARGTRVLDIRSKLDEFASDILDHMHSAAMRSDDLEQISKVGFGLLDRAGYGAVAKVQNVPAQAPVTAQDHHLARIASALDLSVAVDTSVMPIHVPGRPPEESVQSPSADGAASHQTEGPASLLSSPPVDPPASRPGPRLTKVGA